MKSKLWLKLSFAGLILIQIFICGINFIIDPYNIFNSNLTDFNKIKQSDKMRLVKILKVKDLKPKSIILGTSRAEFGFDPEHEYFIKPSYNFAVSSGSMYENRLNFEWALKQGNLEQVFLVLDYIMLNDSNQKVVSDFEEYFNNPNIYKYLISFDTFFDSIYTIIGRNKNYTKYLNTGQREHNYYKNTIMKNGGHLSMMINNEKNYYKYRQTDFKYKDTQKDSWNDLDQLIKLCYEHNLKLNIIFGPNHIRLWESFSYYLGFETFLNFKKMVVERVEFLSKEYKKEAYPIIDFAIYNELTAEKIPSEKNQMMKYHWESSHYKHELGEKVLNDLLLNNKNNLKYGVLLNSANIDSHIKKLKEDRKKYINTDDYIKEVFENK